KLAEKRNGQAVDYTVKELGNIDGYRVSMDVEDYGNMIITNTRIEAPQPDVPHTPDTPIPNKPEHPESGKTTPKHPTHTAPKQAEKPNIIGFLPDTGQMIVSSWMTWLSIALLLILGVILIIKRKKQ
ncbi:TPA: LPXTG cell wall anchor domain-containing protein, partial [Staphylococcus delphini]|nr:LPXTG cell wall anchor domain-containing protein [Staphylococcus delphini]